jgi:hypothetical protein
LLAAAVAFAMVIAAAVHPSSVVIGRVLAVKPLVWLGLVSYGVYLFHWPIFLWLTPTRTGLSGDALLAVRAGVTLLLAVASYRLLEMPVRRGSLGLPQLRIAIPAVAALAVVAIIATTMGSTGREPAVALPDERGRTQTDDTSTPAKADELRAYVTGDSQAFRLGFTEHHLPFGIYQESRSMLGCGVTRGLSIAFDRTIPDNGTCHMWPDIYRQGFDEVRPDVSVLFVGAWEVFDRQFDDRRLMVFSDEYRDYLMEQLELARSILTARGTPLVILGPACYDRPILYEQDGAIIQNDAERLAWVNGVFRDFAAAHADTTTFVDLGPLLCPDGEPRNTVDGTLVREDGMHFTSEGATLVWKWLEPKLRAVADGRTAAAAAAG